MNPSVDDIFDAAEALEHLASVHKAKPRLKNALDLKKLIDEKSAKFEIDDMAAELSLDDDDEEIPGLDMESYTKSYFSEKVQGAVRKHPKTLDALASLEFISGSFEDMEKDMTSIHEKDLIKKQVLQTGTGRIVPENCKVFVHYTLVGEGADEPFDSTVLRNTPAIFDLRIADMIPGFYLALRSMEVNEVSKFIVKSPMAYGEHGIPPRIAPGADILMILEVLQIIEEKLLESPLFMTAHQRATLPFTDILEVTYQLRSDGNGYFSDGNYWFSVKRYRKAITLLEDYPVVSTADEDKRNSLLHTIYANLAQSYLKLERPAQACTSCKIGLKFAEGKDSVKLLFRFAKAKLLLADCEEAVKLCDQALKLDSANAEVKHLKEQASLEHNKQLFKNKQMYQQMFKK